MSRKIIFFLALLMSFTPILSIAAEKENEKVPQRKAIKSYKEINDYEVLYDMAKKGVGNDITEKVNLQIDSQLTQAPTDSLSETSNQSTLLSPFQIDSIYTTQKIETFIDETGKEVTLYKTTVFSDLYLNENKDPNEVGILKDEADPTGSAKHTLNIYYYTTLNYGYTFAQLYKVEGKWTKLDSRTQIYNASMSGYAVGTQYDSKLIGAPRFDKWK